MQRINQDIRTGSFQPVYLLYGEETYLVNQYKKKLQEALGDPEDQMNNHLFRGKEPGIGEVIDLAETLPFLAERRVIVWENSGLFKAGGEQLAEYLNASNESTVFVFAETEIDKRSKLYKTVAAKGYAAEFARQTEEMLRKWVKTLVDKEGKEMQDRTVQLFLSKTGNDMENIRMETEKLLCYCMDKPVIGPEDVEAVCVTRIAGHIFEMVDAIAGKDQKKVMDLYYDLKALREPPMRILFLVARQCNLLMQVKEMQQRNTPQKEMAQVMGVPPFAVKKYIAQAEKFSAQKLRTALTKCVEAEEAVKTAGMDDVLSLEVLLMTVLA